MKNRFFIITCCVAVSLLTSCVHDTEVLFNKPVAERIAESLQAYRELLTAQTNGWLVEYYPEKTRKYGGFNLYFRFEGDHVTVRSEIDPAISATSTWTMGTDMGPTINFDTYNKVLHWFSDPAIPQGGGYGLNYEGDYEFIVESGTASEFILRGKKTKNVIRMTPFENLSWEEYSQILKVTDQNVIAPAYKMTVGGKEVSIVKNVNANVFTLKTGDVTISAPFTVTLTGIKFYEPITILNETLQVFTYHATEDKMVSNQGNSEISFVYIPLSHYFVDYLNFTDWYFATDGIGTGFLPAWNAAKNALENEDGEDLLFMWFGALDPDYPVGISFACWDDENNAAWFGTYVYDFVIVSDNRVKLVYNSDRTIEDGINAKWYMSRLQNFTISAFDGKTFTLEPDVDITNPKNITKIQKLKLTDAANPDHWVTVGLETVIYP